jgi:2,3,4,5-tetrahydropyridine-2,6-dicarboxylate N-succinyltransferase
MTDITQEIIEQAFEDRSKLSSDNCPSELKKAMKQALLGLNDGSLRVAEKTNGQWHTNQWLKKTILIYFRLNPNQLIQTGELNFWDKVAIKFNGHSAQDFENVGARIVPGAIVRTGSYIGKNCVLMPSFVNIGAYIDEGCMIDTWATVGSCAQIGKNVHLSGGAGIGGILEPLQATPTIIEDNCFIGARSEIVEGVIVGKNSVISMGVFIGQSTKIYNRLTDEVTYGYIPEGSVVVAGSLPCSKSKCHLNCAVIVKQVDEKTRAKTSINELLRD